MSNQPNFTTTTDSDDETTRNDYRLQRRSEVALGIHFARHPPDPDVLELLPGVDPQSHNRRLAVQLMNLGGARTHLRGYMLECPDKRDRQLICLIATLFAARRPGGRASGPSGIVLVPNEARAGMWVESVGRSFREDTMLPLVLSPTTTLSSLPRPLAHYKILIATYATALAQLDHPHPNDPTTPGSEPPLFQYIVHHGGYPLLAPDNYPQFDGITETFGRNRARLLNPVNRDIPIYSSSSSSSRGNVGVGDDGTPVIKPHFLFLDDAHSVLFPTTGTLTTTTNTTRPPTSSFHSSPSSSENDPHTLYIVARQLRAVCEFAVVTTPSEFASGYPAWAPGLTRLLRG